MADATATILAALIGACGTVLAVIAGGWFLRGKVKDVEGALEHMRSLIANQTHETRLKLGELDEQFTAALKKLNEIGSAQEDSRLLAAPTEHPTEIDLRAALIEQWERVRQKIEEAASSPDLDGRTAAAYARRDRRSYWMLLDELASKQHLSGERAAYDEALSIWMSFRNKRAEPTVDDVSRLTELADRIVQF